MIPISGGHHVWVKPVLSGHGGIPVLTLHGGPGFPHFYLECFEDFLPQAGISYVLVLRSIGLWLLGSAQG